MRKMTVGEIVRAVNGELLSGNPETEITHVSIDSRDIPPGSIFVPIIGEKTDAHRFIPEVAEKGAAASFLSRNAEEIQGKTDPRMALIRVSDTGKALQDMAYAYREQIRIPLIGITGSVGKTTTREMVAAALSAGFQVYKTPANHNSQIGVPLTLMEIDDSYEIGVIEMGMSIPGEMTKISRLVKPAAAIVTNIGIAHIEQLGSRENIRTEKMNIQDGMPAGGTLLFNADDDMLTAYKAREGHRTLYYGTVPGKGNWAENISLKNGCASFLAHIGEKTVAVRLSVNGRHQVLNAMAALSAAALFHVDPEAAAEKLREFRGFRHRQQIFVHNGITVIDDTYNASPVSMMAAIDILHEMETKGRKIAVLADMKELGPESKRLHAEVGRYLAEGRKADVLFSLGELAAELSESVKAAGQHISVYEYADPDTMEEELKRFVRPGDTVLFKGSNSMHLSGPADRMSGNAE